MKYATKLPKGGVNPPTDIRVPTSFGITNAVVPARAVIPLLQHAGSPARCLVKPGDAVREGMLIGKAEGPLSANVHSSIPGTVVDVGEIRLPTGVSCPAVTIELGGEFDRSGKSRPRLRWDGASRLDLLGRVQAAGVVGLGGGLQPTHLKLAVAPGRSVSLLVANGMECEPSLSADLALLREKPSEIAEAIRICATLLSPGRTVLALGEGSEDLAAAYEKILRESRTSCEIAVLPSRYPQGHEQLVLAALESTAPRAAGSAVVLNVATLYAVFEAVVQDAPLVERVLTVTGKPVATPRNLKVRIGTPVSELLDECGGLTAEPGRIVMGGPMRGVAVESLETPVTKGTSGVVVFPRERARTEWPCIRCGLCIEACPWDLVPSRLHKLIRMGQAEAADREGLPRCTECGCCAYACPSRIPLVAVMREGKRALERGADG